MIDEKRLLKEIRTNLVIAPEFKTGNELTAYLRGLRDQLTLIATLIEQLVKESNQ